MLNNRPRHILSSDQFDREFLDYLYQLVNLIRRYDKSKEGLLYLKSLLPHVRAMLYFTQPSTRTFMSFHSACNILGVSTSEIRDSATSSEKKGESIEDSLRTFSSYVDLIVMRSTEAGLCERIAALLDNTPRPVPIINAGSGPDEHPTQALLDIYTLRRSFHGNQIDGKRICMVGDLKRGRTVRSLSKLLANYQDVAITFASPEAFRIEQDLSDCLTRRGVAFTETEDFEGAIRDADAIYMTRIQDEWDTGRESAAVDHAGFCLHLEHMRRIKPDCVIMHPLPRRDEIDPLIDSDPRAKYWRQERNGMWVRVALIMILMGVDHQVMLPEL
ncbi:MAG: aspartate carbamoyltransferase [Candidatus Sedimenticola endophacoides]